MYYSDRIERDAIFESLRFCYRGPIRRIDRPGIFAIRINRPRDDGYKGLILVIGHRCRSRPSDRQRAWMGSVGASGGRATWWWCRWAKSDQGCWEAIEAYEEGAKP